MLSMAWCVLSISCLLVLLQGLLEECRVAVLAAHNAMKDLDSADNTQAMTGWLRPVAALLDLELDNPTSPRQVYIALMVKRWH